LKKLLKNLGRNRDITVSIASSPVESCVERLADQIGICSEGHSLPDLILWDYPLILSTACIAEIESVCELAERYKSLVISSLSSENDLQSMLLKTDHLGDTLQQALYIPYRRLRNEAASRSLCIGIPTALIPGTESDKPLETGAAWIIVEQWLESLLSKNMPFSFAFLENTHEVNLPEIDEHIAREVENFGFSVLRSHLRGISCDPKVVLEIDSSAAFSSLGFNLIVNRTARLAAEWISEHGKSAGLDVCSKLQQFLILELGPYHILSSNEAVRVQEIQQYVQVEIDSKTVVSGHPVRFEFSLNVA
jgi:hypothetical protein